MPLPKLSVTAGSGTDLRFDALTDNSGNTAWRQHTTSVPPVETIVGSGGTRYVVSAATAFPVGTATHVYLSVEPDGGSIRFWNTGAVPTTLLGHYLGAGAGPIEISNAAVLQAAAAGTTSGTVQVSGHIYV